MICGLQIFLSGFMPVATFYFAGVVTFFTAFVSACKATGRLSHGYGKQIWQGWLDFLGLLGIAGVLQVWAFVLPSWLLCEAVLPFL